MTTAQGADHTTGNVARMASFDKEFPELMAASLAAQIACAAVDSIGLCLFGRSVTNPNIAFLAEAVNAAIGTTLTPHFFQQLGRETLLLEREFNRAAGFTAADDGLPGLLLSTSRWPPRSARHGWIRPRSMRSMRHMDDVGTEGVPDQYGRVS